MASYLGLTRDLLALTVGSGFTPGMMSPDWDANSAAGEQNESG
jgi:hypothetical protein